jgi:oligogalacturonide lyase
MCADTTFPDIGLQLFDPRDGVGSPRTLCLPEATNEGKHWNTDHCPYDDEDYKQGKWKVYAPQHAECRRGERGRRALPAQARRTIG